MSDENRRFELSRKILDFLFASFRWACSGAPAALEPKMIGLAVDLLEYQRLNHPLYGRYCALNGRETRGVSILDYPPLPVESFKRADICPFDHAMTAAEFWSSGTTEGVRSIHRFRDTGPLQQTLVYAFTEYIARMMPISMRFFSLMPSHEDNPNSSLGYMITRFVEIFGADGSGFFFTRKNGFEVERLIDALAAAERDGVPVHLMGPAFSYVELLDAMGSRRIHCAPGSCLLETGGYKGKSREIPKAELRAMLADRLGLDIHHIYGEYGMCELSSQGYEICALNTPGPLPDECLYVFPGWMRCILLNPENMAPVLPGHEGQIAFFDLCNIDSAAYILTGDVGEMVELSEDLRSRVPGLPKYALRLKGRAPDAVPKGCSMSWEEWNEQVKS